MSSTCRGVVFNGDGTYIRRDDFTMPEPPSGGGVLKVEAVGMCGSDLAQLHGHQHVPGEKSPLVPGHEIVGRVHTLADDTDLGVAVGDRVAVDLIVRVPPTAINPFGAWATCTATPWASTTTTGCGAAMASTWGCWPGLT